ncbi:alpha/beta hydrolase [Radiobacillus kanasensis]|uniref:alpha/beta fold hydrolase n=1 Tax=Radiobacillus kanasensis TaxID=2844358 RepID=UPI001E4ACF2D|nr:alpha/beta hydrolase [Radiobacillus kanasensis]UFT98589.1 alpha/beta hydrolase [Radiobacillus kanasensis]
MPYLTLEDNTQLFYEDHGQGQPVLFIHGVMMSSKFFQKQVPYFQKNYRVLTVDLRGHGQSSKVEHGHTVAQYARDMKAFIEQLDLKDVILVGWSMGAFVVWDYINQFGRENIKATTVVDQSPSDYIWPGWDFGAFDFEAIKGVMQAIQEDQHGFNAEFIHGMYKEKPEQAEYDWVLEEMNKLPASIESTIVFNQTAVDYRDTLGNVTVPTLICFGSVGFFPVEAGAYIQERIPESRLVAFENSSHLLFLEETEKFNQTLDEFFSSL